MKTLLTLLLLITYLGTTAQDQSPIIINVRDNAKLQFNGANVKMKVTVISYEPVTSTTKDFVIKVCLTMYENLAGNYGQPIVTIIEADQTLSKEEKNDLLYRYADKLITYTSAGKYVDVNGNSVEQGTPGAIAELSYWQAFKLNHASLGMTSASTQGALDAEYKIVQAIIAKLNIRKNF